MRLRRWLIGLLVLVVLPLSGCAKLNEWLEGSATEEKKKEGKTPEEELADQKKALAGNKAADRKAAIGKLVGLKLDEANQLIISHVDDADPAVAVEVMSALQTLTGFPEKTEDERQLDPEGYNKQLAAKRLVATQALPKLAAAIQGPNKELRYGAMVVVYNLARPPLEPANVADTLRTQAAQPVSLVALDPTASIDARLLAVDALVQFNAGQQVATLLPLLQDPDVALRGRVALALGQVADGLGGAKADAATKLASLSGDATQPDSVRWQAMASLGRLGSNVPVKQAGLDRPFELKLTADEKATLSPSEQVSPLESYRSYALAKDSSPDARPELKKYNERTDQIATKAEDELAADRKKGYK